MSVSLPSLEIYSVDVPEIKEFTADFRYNFFVPDESVNDSGGIPVFALERDGAEVDSSFLKYSETRVPRFVTFSFKLPKLGDPGRRVSDQRIRDNVFNRRVQNGSLIKDNLSKVITEDHFALDNFTAVTFHDGEIDDKVYRLVSGSFAQQALDEDVDQTPTSALKSAMKLRALLPNQIKPHFAFRALGNSSRSTGTRFFGFTGTRVHNRYFDRLRNVVVAAQMNSKLFHSSVERSIRDPHHPFSGELKNMHAFTKKLSKSLQQRFSPQVSDSDFKTFIPYIDVRVKRGTSHQDQTGPIVVGYIIDKVELSPDGTATSLPPIVIDNPNVNFTADFRVKYGASYVYTVRTVAQFTLPAIDDDTGDIGMVKALISSKPSKKVYVRTEEMVAPPPPSDLSFTWNYERRNPSTADYDNVTGQPVPDTGIPGSLMIHWTFAPNSQRDVKKFQVFRRSSLDEPFELIKMYDFDDSELRYPNREDPDDSLVEYTTSAVSFHFDDDFKVDSRFIYAVASVDAHGLTSNYSAQFEVWFDQFKNRLEKKIVSHSGAPKPYPNLYLEADTFVDTIRVSGKNAKRLKVYFNPEFYHLYDDEGRTTQVVSTKQRGGSYKLQFINIDNQKSAGLSITVDDQTRQAGKKLGYPAVKFGPKRLPLRRVLP